jgi:PAS domain S-box-containing protein
MIAIVARLAARIGLARARNLLVACGLFIGLAITVGAVLISLEMRRQDVENAERELRNVSFILTEEIDRGFQAAELIQLGLIEHMREIGIDTLSEFNGQKSSIEVHRDLKERIAGLPNVDGMALVDLSGRVVNVSRVWPAPTVDVSDRDFFKALHGNSSLTSFVSEPVLNRTNGTWTILMARRFATPEGQFLGIVNCAIQAAYFEALFSRISLGKGASIALHRRDGVLLARYPRVDQAAVRPLDKVANFRRILASIDSGPVRLTSALDGEDRLIASHGLPHFPLVISVSDTMDAILEPWRGQARMFAAATALLDLIIAVIVLLAVRHLIDYERLQAAEAAKMRAVSELVLAQQREQAARDLNAQEQRFDTALNNMVQGLLLFDATGRLLVVNRRFCEMFGLASDALTAGMNYDEMTQIIVDDGNVAANDMKGVRERRAELISRGEGTSAVWEVSGGRAFTVTHQPMDGGPKPG